MNMELMTEWARCNLIDVPWPQTLLLAYIIGRLFTMISVRAAHRFDFLARPNFRSSHTIPTPRIGGVGICAAFLTIVAVSHTVLPNWGIAPEMWVMCLILGGVWSAVGGFLDDVLEFPPLWKLFFQLIPLALVFMFDIVITKMYIPFIGFVYFDPWTSRLLTIIVVIGLINVYNFMDGMDGNAALFAVFVLLGLLPSYATVNAWIFAPETLVIASLIGAILGFFKYNKPETLPNKKTFMGDSGSQFVGFALAILVIRGNEANSRAPVLGSLILVSPFVFDVVYTLSHRIWRRVNLCQGHREHLYQRLLICNNENHALTLRFAIGQFVLALLAGIFYNACAWLVNLRRIPADIKFNIQCIMGALFIVAFCSLIADTFYIRYRERRKKASEQPMADSAPSPSIDEQKSSPE